MPVVSPTNANKNAPWWWKRLESALLIGFVPAFTGFITAIPMEDHEKVWALASAGFFTGIIKTVGILLGDPQPVNNNENNV